MLAYPIRKTLSQTRKKTRFAIVAAAAAGIIAFTATVGALTPGNALGAETCAALDNSQAARTLNTARLALAAPENARDLAYDKVERLEAAYENAMRERSSEDRQALTAELAQLTAERDDYMSDNPDDTEINNENQAAVDAAQRALNVFDQPVTDALAALNAARGELSAAENALRQVETAYTAAQAAFEQARVTLCLTPEPTPEPTPEAVTCAALDNSQADRTLNTARLSLADAERVRDLANDKVERLEAAHENAMRERTPEDRTAAEAELAQLIAERNKHMTDNPDDTEINNENQSAVDAAQRALDQFDQPVTDALAALTAAREELSAAENALRQAKTAYTAAQAAFEQARVTLCLTPEPTPDPAPDTPEQTPETTDVPPPPLPDAVEAQGGGEIRYSRSTAHPEVYGNEEYRMTAEAEVTERDAETDEPVATVITVNLGDYDGPVIVITSVWQADGYYSADPNRGGNDYTLERDGQILRIIIGSDAAKTRFRVDGNKAGLRINLVLGYADGRSG